MVRETRHLWVGNLPDNIREDRIREHFKRYGRVQNVKLLGRTENPTAGPNGVAVSGVCATVAFMDIKSASKAHNAEHVLDERTLTTEYYEPAAIPSAAGAPSAGSSPAGSGYSGSSSSVNSATVPAPNPATVSRYHLSGGEEGAGTCALAATAAAPANWRGTNDSASEYCRRGNTPTTYGRYQRNNSNAPYSTPPSNVESRTTPHHRWYGSGERAERAAGGCSTPSTPGGAAEAGAGAGAPRRRRRSGSGSSRSESTSPEPSDASRASTPAAAPPHPPPQTHAARTPPNNHHQWSSTTSGRPLAICVRNLPTRSTDSSLKDGLYHEYKKHGKVVWVKVVGQNADRYAVVRFKKPSDVEKALEVSQDKLFFGCKISVAPHQSCDEDAESAKPYETDIDEYHPKATRTLFIGNLEKDVTQQQLREKFKHFGRIIEIDIKKGSGGGSGYAFCQYASISSVVEAIRAMDGEYVGGSRVKLGFGKPVATTCVWVDGLTEHTEKQVLSCVSRCGAATSVCVDRAAGAALIHFEQAGAAGAAVRELRRVAAHASAADPERPRLAVDYASRECQDAFYEQLEKHGGSAALSSSERLTGEVTPRYIPSTRHETIRFDSCSSRSRASSYGRGSSRTPRYSSLEHYDPADYAAERRYRVYDELGSSPQTEETPYEDRLQSVVVSPHRARRHRRDSSPEDRKHSKERHRGTAAALLRRSRSGSCGGERHAGRRRHRRRRDGSGSRGSRAGTPLRDEPDAPPSEPRRAPPPRPPLPMSLPLPKFAAQLLRTAPAAPRPAPAPAPAPDSPPRPHSASSSSAGSAPHSPSLEERIRSLDEKYEKWSGSRVAPEAPDRTRLRHRLLEVDINEVKPSDVVLSLLAKRSVFDEDSERLEGATRAPSPTGSPRARAPACVPRALRYPFPAHPSPGAPHTPPTPPQPHAPSAPQPPQPPEPDSDASDRPSDPRLNRPERPFQLERLGKFHESDYRLESRIRLRTPSTDKPQIDVNDRRQSPKTEREKSEFDRDPRRENERRRRDSFYGGREGERRLSLDTSEKDIKEAIEKIDPDYQKRERRSSLAQEKLLCGDSSPQFGSSNDKSFSSINISGKSELSDVKKEPTESSLGSGSDENDSRSDDVLSIQSDKKPEPVSEQSIEKEPSSSDESSVKSDISKPDIPKTNDISHLHIDNKLDHTSFHNKSDSDKCKEILIQNHINKELHDFEVQHIHLNAINSIKTCKEVSELGQELLKSHDKNGKERFNQSIILEAFHKTKLEKENIEFDKACDKERYGNNTMFLTEKKPENDKTLEDRSKHDREKLKHGKDRSERHEHDRDKSKSNKTDRPLEKLEKEKRQKDDLCEKIKIEKDSEKSHKEKSDRESDKNKHNDEKSSRHEHHRKDKSEKDKRKDNDDKDSSKAKKEDKHKHDKSKKDGESKREGKNDSTKIRKSSRDESTKDLCRKDSTDSTTSRASHDSVKLKDFDQIEIKEEKSKGNKYYNDLFIKQEPDKDVTAKDHCKPESTSKISESTLKIKTEIKEEKDLSDQVMKTKTINSLDHTPKCKMEVSEKQRHYSVDSPNLDCKRKERLNSSSSLPSNIGLKRRMSSQDSLDSFNEDLKKCRNEPKIPERRDSKDSRNTDRHKTTKFNKGHFAKIIESKTKDDKKNQVKPPDDFPVLKDVDSKDQRKSKKGVHGDNEDRGNSSNEHHPEGLQNDLDFLATLELRSSEEDERQKALRKEMKEKKRIQQLQQIQELQMQQDALQHAELMGKIKDDKKNKIDDKKKEAAREKRMSTDRKSRDEKSDNSRRKSRKQLQSTDTSDSDEPKKHSIFDIVDDEPTYISMYDKVKARSCKNMQKQEEEKRQEKIKAKFSQLKQSRAKREEKKRSSWDEDSDSDPDRRKTQKISMDSSSDDEQILIHNKKREKSHVSSLDYDRMKSNDYYNITSNEEDSRNKLSRKNSRTRIISDTSDDDGSKRSISKSPNFISEIRKEFMSNFDSLQKGKDDDVPSKLDSSDKVKKNSLLNLFGKSDSEDSKTKTSSENNDTKPGFMKPISNDFSSESESTMSNRISAEIRKKHKKKQKKHKVSISDDESKVESSDALPQEGDSKHKNSEKFRRHSNKKEKRKDKIRESIDLDDSRDDKIKKDKKFGSSSFDSVVEQSNNNKKEGKMEDIFGPLSDESDRELGPRNNKPEFLTHDYDSTYSDQIRTNNEDSKIKEKDENRRKREKKRKERRPLIKDDDNSLDMDAVSKAIEARLFADTMNDDDSRSKMETPSESLAKTQQNIFYTDSDLNIDSAKDKHSEKLRRDSKEKKKKKKKNREERQNRKDHRDRFDRNDFLSCGRNSEEMSPKTMLLDIPLPTEAPTINLSEKSDDSKSHSESPSLPRLTDSPPVQGSHNRDSKRNDSDVSDRHGSDHDMDVEYVTENTIEVTDIPMPPPPTDNNIIQDISEVPLPSDPVPIKSENIKVENFLTSFGRDIDVSEDAVRSISNLEKEIKIEPVDKIDAQAGKEKKIEEKPRAIISQEETEDAVAALLGESFGGKESTFPNCYEEVETSTTHQIETEISTIETEIIPEEDAEEMRQAVQNLNASEMEIKPDTPLSDNDLLLIDTDSEAETSQDAIDRLPVNVIATNQSRNANSEQSKPEEASNVITKPVTSQAPTSTETTEPTVKTTEPEIKSPPPKRDIVQQVTSTATPVITSWTLSNNKILEPHVVNVQSNHVPNRETNDNKPTHISANIVQIKTPQNQTIATPLRPIIAPNRVSAPYQVINHMIRPQVSNMQPPTIKIPEPHIIYQKPPSIVISPRMAGEPRQQSPKTSPQGEGMTSPRLANMTILSTSPQNMTSVGIAPPNTIQQRSPGQVTVVRMQQPPLSPIQSMHMTPGARTMVSPNRPNSVLVQTQGGPIHFNRLPVTPVLAPISKQIGVNNILQQNKTIAVSASPIIHQQKVITGDSRKTDQRNVPDNINENTKIILSPTSLQHSTNPTVLAQNRLISMQNALHSGNINSPLHLTNKVLINNMPHLGEKRENLIPKSEQHNNLPFSTAPIIHVANVNHSSPSIMQTTSKPVVCAIQEANNISRAQNTNVIHSLNSQRLLTTAPISSVIQLDTSKSSPSVLSMAAIRSPTVFTKLESSNSVAVTTTSLTNVVMTPLLLKTSNTPGTIRLSAKSETEKIDTTAKLQNSIPPHDNKFDAVVNSAKTPATAISDKQKDIMSSSDSVAKCETDFEELLKDNTNEIKVTNDPEKKLEVNVGKTVTLISPVSQRKKSVEIFKEDVPSVINQVSKETVKENKELVSNNKVEHETKDTKVESSNVNPEPDVSKKEDSSTANKEVTPDAELNKVAAEEQKTPEFKDNDSVNTFFKLTPQQSDSSDSQSKGLDENDSWSAKDLNIESVIKKVDSLCNDSLETDKREDNNLVMPKATESVPTSQPMDSSHEESKPMEVQSESDNFMDDSYSEESSLEKTTPSSKRGGRGMRGKKSEKNQDRVQTRQISKPARGATSARRGRGGRAKVEKKIKSLVNHTANNMPGDVYDFHEDSGDETSTSPNKNETRPRLILTIKSPLSGQSNAVATSTLSITPKEQQLKNTEKVNKEEKAEDFISPSANTRKSRRLQEKDVQRSTVDDVIEDVVKGNAIQTKVGKEPNKKRQTRQTGANKASPSEKTASTDTRKSPRGVKRTRDRSLSDASMDSSDEKVGKRDEAPKDSKVPKMAEPPPASKTEPDPPQPAKTVTPAAPVAAPPPSAPTPAPIPIMKPPKKMISEISAKLASAFEAAAAAPPARPQPPVERVPLEAEKRPAPHYEPFAVTPVISDLPAAATGDVRGSGPGGGIAESAAAEPARRAETAAGGAGGGAGGARVQSPALPVRLAAGGAPLLLRAAADEYGARPRELASLPPAARGGAGGAGAARYAGAASLPRGAHQPPPHAHALPPPAAPAIAHAHPHAKQVAVVGPHHHHQVPGSRVTITSVPTISPQGQMALSADLVRSPPPAHQQTSPVTSVYHNGDGMYPHFSHQHYQMYQQHFRATQHESRATPSPYTRTLEAEGCEAPTPPLELRRPPSARVPRPAHSPAPAPAPAPGPADRLIMYAAGCGRSPPPAHGTSRLPSALPPTAAPGPPHASQVPREADSLQMLLQRYPVMWQGLLALKNDSAAVQMHFVGGNPAVAGDTLPRLTDGSTPPLRIAQRMRLEPQQLDQVHRKMKLENEHCMLLALPCGRDHMDVLQQSTNLTAGFITYLQRKQAAGIVNVAPPGHHQAMYTVHIFPSCDFANENLNRIAPDLMHRVADIAHLLIVIATV